MLINPIKRKRLPILLGAEKTYAQKVLGLSPIVYYPLNEASGTTAIDLVAGRNGTYTGVDLAQSQPPFVCPFWDGLNDYCALPAASLSTILPKQAGSLSAWAKAYDSSVWSAGQLNIATLTTIGNNDRWWLAKGNLNTTLYTHKAGATSIIPQKTGLSTLSWFHMVLTWSIAADQVYAWFNNTIVAASPYSGLGTPTANNLWTTQSNIGSIGQPSTVFHGWIAHVSLWDRVLSDPDRTNLYNWGLV